MVNLEAACMSLISSSISSKSSELKNIDSELVSLNSKRNSLLERKKGLTTALARLNEEKQLLTQLKRIRALSLQTTPAK